jgi:glucose-6-phosphate 1-dehydrogenase
MLQVLASVMANPPGRLGHDAWRAQKGEVIKSLAPLTPDDAVRGQYDGYLDVAGVDPKSTTESYVAVRLSLDTWRWAGVPIAIRAGKCMPATATEVAVRFRRPHQDIFGLTSSLEANVLRFRIWPESQVGLSLTGKMPGSGWTPQVEELTFAEAPGSDQRPYDRLIGAALAGQVWLFAAQETVEAAWRVVEPVLGDVVPVVPYAQGSWGPKEADALLPHGVSWHDPVG